jgi:2-C-methyl-D-erythritol 4-phosphate cytidylyltransferase
MVRYSVVIPAAGIGRRMGADRPKQYLLLAGRPILEHVCRLFLSESGCRAVVVGLDDNDPSWETLELGHDTRLIRAPGGGERCHTVLNALQALEGTASASDWVLVHDAARPCLRRADLHRLLDDLADDPVGGLLAVPAPDTMKRADSDNRVAKTVARTNLWHAQTPQMFRLGALGAALRAALKEGGTVTDDAEAMERAGYRPRLIEGHPDNLKITRPEDLERARRIFSRGQ